jgi:hypothetical protein
LGQPGEGALDDPALGQDNELAVSLRNSRSLCAVAEGLILAGAVMLVVGCIRAGWSVIQAEWKWNASRRAETSKKEQ